MTNNTANALFADLQNINTEALADMTQVKSGGNSRTLPQGTALVRPCLYIEYGMQPKEFNGVAKAPEPQAVLGFRIVGGGGLSTDKKPEAYVLTAGEFPLIKTYDFGLSFYDRSKVVKYLKALNRVGDKATHIVQKIMEQPLYALPIRHTPAKDKFGKDYTKVEFDWEGMNVALDSETFQPRVAPELKPEHIQVFLWEQPTQAMWDSIHIEGKWEEKKDDKGVVTMPERSKNVYQEKCLTALDFEGSALQQLLGGVPAPTLTVQAVPSEEVAEPVEQPEAITAPVDTNIPDLPAF